MSRRYRSHLIRRRRWLTDMSSSRTSSAAHLPWLPSLPMEFGWIYKKGKKAATEFVRVEKYKETRIVVSIDVFEAEALGWYL